LIRASAALLAILLLASLLSFIPARGAVPEVVFSEDFETGTFPGRDWDTGDLNDDSGLDYWGRSTYQSHSGFRSAWCAQYGTNEENGEENSINHYPDRGMNAYLRYTLPGLTYGDMTLTFWYWAETGGFDLFYSSDYVRLAASDGTSSRTLWTQPEDNSDGWQKVEVDLEADTVWIEFAFISGSGGLWSGQYEGVYLDDIEITGESSRDLISSVSELDEYQINRTFYIPFEVENDGSGLDYVELYFRKNGVGNFSKYVTSSNPQGRWTGDAIPFSVESLGGDGFFEFFTRAVDMDGNREDLKDEAVFLKRARLPSSLSPNCMFWGMTVSGSAPVLSSSWRRPIREAGWPISSTALMGAICWNTMEGR